MKSKCTLIILFLGLLIIVQSCINNQKDIKLATNITQDIKGTIIADSILYDVIICDMDQQDPWEAERLKAFNHEEFVSFIFDNLYSKRFTAYNFHTHTKLSTKEIRNIEHRDGFDRKKISKVQFNEIWYADTLGLPAKKIKSIILGLETYSNQGTFLGHEALFRVKFEPNDQ